MVRLLLAVGLVALLVLAGSPVLREIGSQTSGVTDDIGSRLGGDGGASGGRVVRVTRIVDGDTIRVSGGERVRYIGIDTPEVGRDGRASECFADAATRRNAALVEGERVRLVGDVEAQDRYGRTLAYVYRARDGVFVNAALVREGYARTLTVPPDVRHAAEFAKLAARARSRDRGLWSQC